MEEYAVNYQDRQFVAVQSSKKNIFASDLNDAAEKYFSMLSNREAVSGVRVEPVSFFDRSDWIANPQYIKGSETAEPIFKSSEMIEKSIETEILERILETQTKQLYWIRIIGIPFLMAAIVNLFQSCAR
jgi:hypothetical protein